MFAEGSDDQAHLLTSTDRVRWTRQGALDIRKADGTPIAPGPFGTPAVLREDGAWYLFYERDDVAIWLATSTDLKVWTNVQDAPVIERGPDAYDQTMIALNQVIQYKGRYYAYYHATGPKSGNNRWNLSVAVSTDKIHWKKYPKNPVIPEDHSSGFLVDDGKQLRLYCMHPKGWLYFPKK
ncbi:MAG: hypothetical protein FJY92_06710 [Candidatus Hydrogenedentes bacterium]|nr:hypothetical protein [Candidatus Hydrogenedentota bacterium]